MSLPDENREALKSKGKTLMKTQFPVHFRFFGLMIFALCILALVVLIPGGGGFADSNEPTVTNSPVPTDTPIPDSPTPGPPSETPYPNPPDGQNNIQMATAIPPASKPNGGLSTIDRILLVCIAVATILAIGVIVYLLYEQTRSGGIDNRFR